MMAQFGFRVLVLLTAGFGSLALNGCSSIAQSIIKEPKVALSQVSVRDVGVNGATVMVGVLVDNPNVFALIVDSLKYTVDIGGKQLTTGEVPDRVSVPGSGSKVIEIPVAVKFQDLYSSMFDFLQKTSSNYRIRGEARFGLLTVPFDQTGDLKLR